MADNNENKVLNVPHLRFPEFSGEWEEHTLSEYLEFKNGLNPDAKRIGSGLPFISVMDILSEGVINYDNIRGKVNATEKEIECFGVKDGDLLFQRSSETLEDVGRANVYMDNRTAIYGGFVIRGRKIGNYDPLFFKYLLATPLARKRTCRMGAGAQHFNIGQEGLSKISLYFPSIEEQRKIAEFLSLIDERIATQNKIIEDLKKLKSAISERLFNAIKGDVVVLEDIGDVVKGKQINGEFLSESGKYYVMNGGIEPSGFYNDYNVEANTISISEGGNSCGYVQFNACPFWSGGHCYTIQNTTDNVKTEYLYQFLKSKESEIMKLRIGSGLPNIQKKDLAKFKITIPNISEQKVISAFLSSFERKADVEMNFVNLLLEEKQYLLRQMFI
ncbi:restriction endonuclease subunit S [Bacteroides fragilis]|uniref:restriction endonuclease subunit S n=1 Tax=Bacteroides fragilis TaxID=817 RepID=UPI0022AB0515|nr:restriction endonuclease subunit S [Bacteroides fragilis]MCZ2558351.1 restriction endonuclease subunit S [Bacteroides fragilis]